MLGGVTADLYVRLYMLLILLAGAPDRLKIMMIARKFPWRLYARYHEILPNPAVLTTAMETATTPRGNSPVEFVIVPSQLSNCLYILTSLRLRCLPLPRHSDQLTPVFPTISSRPKRTHISRRTTSLSNPIRAAARPLSFAL